MTRLQRNVSVLKTPGPGSDTSDAMESNAQSQVLPCLPRHGLPHMRSLADVFRPTIGSCNSALRCLVQSVLCLGLFRRRMDMEAGRQVGRQAEIGWFVKGGREEQGQGQGQGQGQEEGQERERRRGRGRGRERP